MGSSERRQHPLLLERKDGTLAAWYRWLYAPRAGGAYDSHHRTAGIAGRTWRRGGGLAAGGAGAATGAPRDRGGTGAIVMAGDPGFWDVAWNWPLPFVTAVAVRAVPMAGIIWFICQLIPFLHQSELTI